MARAFQLSALMITSLMLASCFSGGTNDKLRENPPAEGIFLDLWVNLPSNADAASVAAAIYDDAERQPLVGGDFFVAESSQQGDSAVLKSIENLSGDYQGKVSVSGINDSVTVSTEYDPERAREDRWYPTDELLVDPGPNEKLVDFGNQFIFPQSISVTLNQNVYTSRNEQIDLTWNAGDGDQMRAVSLVTCYGSEGESYSYPRVTYFGEDDDGALNNDGGDDDFRVGDVIPNETIVNAIGTFLEEIAAIIAISILETYTFGLVDASDVPLSSFVLTSCDVELTFFREIEYELQLSPDKVADGNFISSTSDTVNFTYQP